MREVQAAQRRRNAERLTATRAVFSELRNELGNAVTGILISSELALAVPSLPVAAAAKIKCVHELAEGIREQLERRV